MINKRRLGRTELLVTEVSFGAMNLRKTGSFNAANKLLDHTLDSGINLIDTARGYNGECEGQTLESEVLVGEAVKRRTDLSEPVAIITKGHGYTPGEFDSDLEISLNKLGITGRHDLRIGKNPIKLIYFLHGISTERWDTINTSGVLNTIQQAKNEGLINYAGFSSHYPYAKEIKEAADTGVFDVVELPYNVFNRSLGEDGETDLLKYLNEKDIGVVNMKAFDGNQMADVYPVLHGFMEISYDEMLNFCLSNPYISTVDAGATAASQIDADIAVSSSPRFDAETLKSLKNEADKISPHMKNTCRECSHCNEKFKCPAGIDFMEVLSVYSRYNLSKCLGRDTTEFYKQYKNLKLNGKDCAGCGDCLPWCEYRLDVPRLMKTADEIFNV